MPRMGPEAYVTYSYTLTFVLHRYSFSKPLSWYLLLEEPVLTRMVTQGL